jgi:hypothetical protein
MYVVRARLEGPGARFIAGGEHSSLFRSARPADGLEHVHVAHDPLGVYVTLFLLHPTVADARSAAIRICTRLCDSFGLGQLVLVSCEPSQLGTAD